MKQEYKVTCPFCAIGCRFKILKGMDEVVFSNRNQDNLDFDHENEANEGALCPRGHFSYELMYHPKRLSRAYYKSNGSFVPEIPEMIFSNIVEDLEKSQREYPMAVLIDPMLSLHNIRSLLEFARNNDVEAVEFLAPVDRHLFRALVDFPLDYTRCSDIKNLGKFNNMLCIGDIFTNQPVFSRHLLKSKYAFRANKLFVINPIPTRTSWFADTLIEHAPHQEPLFLLYILKQLLKSGKTAELPDQLQWLSAYFDDELNSFFTEFVSAEKKADLDRITAAFLSGKKNGIFFSAQLYTAAGAYLTATICAAISHVTGCVFVPLHSNSNFSAIVDLIEELFPAVKLGQKPSLKNIIENQYAYILAAGFNPEYAMPGNFKWPTESKWMITSLVQGNFPPNTRVLLPQAHIYEQMDYRTNFIPGTSLTSEQVRPPVGSAQPVSQFTFNLHRILADRQISLSGKPIPVIKISWQDKIKNELNYYINRLKSFNNENGSWMVPVNHIVHHKDGFLTRHGSWAKNDCTDNLLTVSTEIANKHQLKNGSKFIFNNGKSVNYKIEVNSKMPVNTITPYAHHLPSRKLMSGEFAEHNDEYYFWCPKLEL